MVLPLYRLKNEYARERENLIEQAKGNTGLIFNKYFLGWEDNWDIKAGAKSGWIKQIGKNFAGNKILLEEAVERLLNLTDSLAGKFRCYKTIWRFATGLGLNNPVENGMAWHHTLGVPYLPGSSVKGLVRSWAEQWLDYPSQDEINRIFGPREVENEHEAAESVGSVIFFDALPAAPVRLAADVMTPHYQNYYGGNEPPGDWMDPNPIPFLTVDKEQVFLFTVAPRERDDAVSRSDLETVLQWMNEALANIGAGAKTATGYGRFIRCAQTESRLTSARLRLQEEKAKQISSIPAHLAGPIAEEMSKDQYDTNPEEFLQTLKTKWLTKMQADETSAADQQTIARLLKNWYQVYREGQWEKPNPKNTPIIEAIRKTLGEEMS